MNKKLKEIILRKIKKNKFYGLGIYNRSNLDRPEKMICGCFFLKIEESKDFGFHISAQEGTFSISDPNLELFYVFKTRKELFVFLDVFLDSFKDFNQLYDYIFYKLNFFRILNESSTRFQKITNKI